MASDDETGEKGVGADRPPRAKDRGKADLREHVYRMALAGALALLATATIVYHVFEDWSWVDSFYFSAIAATTVGFGDLSPTTDFTKLFTVGYVFLGISLIGVVLNERLRRHATHVGHRRSKRSDD
jgi:hypothetical protein